jgi:polar amino acid transport system substrate-binding protein
MNVSRFLKRYIAPACAALCLTTAAMAQDKNTLDQIMSRGKIIVGMDMSAPPYAFMDENNQPTGSEYETAKLLAADLGVELEIVQTSGANRVPYMVTGRVDIMMGAFAIIPDRAKSVWFSSPYATVYSMVMAKKELKVENYSDLVGKKIAVARGGYTEQVLIKNAPKGVDIVRFEDDPQAMAALTSGQVDAYGVGSMPGRTLMKRFPQMNYEEKIPMEPRLWYGFGVRRGQSDLLQYLNTFVYFHIGNGDLPAIYKKFTGDTLPLPAPHI